MAKLKPLRKEEDISAVPLTEPVLVELMPPPTGAEDDVGQDDAGQREPERKEPDDPGVKQLKDQLELHKAAETKSQEALTAAQRERDEALKLAGERQSDLRKAQGDREQAVSDSVANALSAAQSEEEAAQAEYAKAYEAADPMAMAKAQSKISRAASKILNAEAAAAELADHRERLAKEPEPQVQQQQRPVDIATAVQNNPNLLPKERTWLLEHQDLLVDRGRGIELEAAYIKATRAKKIRGTDAYFKFLDKELGYAEPEKEANEETDDNEGSTIMSAPPSRDGVSLSSGRSNTPSRIELSPEQRAMAKSMGVSDTAYARQVLALQQAKKDDPEKFGRR